MALPVLAGCSAGLEWRSVRPEGWALEAQMPCRPAQATRHLLLGTIELDWTLWSCEAAGRWFAIGSADLGRPDRVGPVLSALSAAASAGLNASAEPLGPASVPGSTPYSDARRYRVAGRTGDGAVRVMEGVVFARGTRVFQVQWIGEQADAGLSAAMFGGLRVAQPS